MFFESRFVSICISLFTIVIVDSFIVYGSLVLVFSIMLQTLRLVVPHVRFLTFILPPARSVS